jgi:hypothetical protein
MKVDETKIVFEITHRENGPLGMNVDVLAIAPNGMCSSCLCDGGPETLNKAKMTARESLVRALEKEYRSVITDVSKAIGKLTAFERELMKDTD